MKAIVGRWIGHSNAANRLWPRAAVAILLGLACTAAAAFDDDGMALVMAQMAAPGGDERPVAKVELSATTLPRFDNIDGANRTSRIGMTLLPPRRSSLGFALGMTSSDGPAFMGAPPSAGFGQSVDVGLHWRYTMDSHYRIDVTAWRRLAPPDALSMIQTRQPSYGARVEMRVGPAVPKAGLVVDRGFVGFQLDSGARITLKRSGGKPMVYYRAKF